MRSKLFTIVVNIAAFLSILMCFEVDKVNKYFYKAKSIFEVPVRIQISAQDMSKEDSALILHRDLSKNGIRPVLVTIYNNSIHTLTFSKEGIDIKSLDGEKVANFIVLEAMPRAIIFRILGFVFWPFIIPGALDTLYTQAKYQKIRLEYFAKGFKNLSESIPPYSAMERVLYLPKSENATSYSHSFFNVDQGKEVTIEVIITPVG